MALSCDARAREAMAEASRWLAAIPSTRVLSSAASASTSDFAVAKSGCCTKCASTRSLEAVVSKRKTRSSTPAASLRAIASPSRTRSFSSMTGSLPALNRDGQTEVPIPPSLS
jgi:hypothetical protein